MPPKVRRWCNQNFVVCFERSSRIYPLQFQSIKILYNVRVDKLRQTGYVRVACFSWELWIKFVHKCMGINFFTTCHRSLHRSPFVCWGFLVQNINHLLSGIRSYLVRSEIKACRTRCKKIVYILRVSSQEY